MSTEEYISLVYKNLKGEISDSEFRQLNINTAKSAELAKIRLELEDAWDISGDVKTIVTSSDTDRLLSSVKESTRVKAKDNPARVFTFKRFISSIAALAILTLGVLFLIKDKATIYDSPGLYTLADNTKVNLRPNSKITVVSFTEEVREVILRGEAFFDVSRDINRPFTVSAEHVKVEVLGTSFLVKELEDETYVNLLEGKVKTTDRRTNEYFMLSPGQSVRHNTVGNIEEISNYQNLSSWKDQFYQFQNTTLSNVIEELSLIHDASIQIPNQQVSDCKFSGSLAGENLEKLLTILTNKYEATLKKNGDEWIIDGGQCN